MAWYDCFTSRRPHQACVTLTLRATPASLSPCPETSTCTALRDICLQSKSPLFIHTVSSHTHSHALRSGLCRPVVFLAGRRHGKVRNCMCVFMATTRCLVPFMPSVACPPLTVYFGTSLICLWIAASALFTKLPVPPLLPVLSVRRTQPRHQDRPPVACLDRQTSFPA